MLAAAAQRLMDQGIYPPPVQPTIVRTQDGTLVEHWDPGVSQAAVWQWRRYLGALADESVRLGSFGRTCPGCSAPEGFIESPLALPQTSPLALAQKTGATKDQAAKTSSGFHPAFYIIAAASVVGAIIEVAKFTAERKAKKETS